jgi:hypothetical protein
MAPQAIPNYFDKHSLKSSVTIAPINVRFGRSRL